MSAAGSAARRSSATRCAISCRSATCSPMSRRSCASTISRAGATTSSRRASRSCVHEKGLEAPARGGRGRIRRAARGAALELPADRSRAHRAPISLRRRSRRAQRPTSASSAAAASDAQFADFFESNVAPHKVPGYAIVTVSLKPIGGVPGDATRRPDGRGRRSRRGLFARRTARLARAEPHPAACRARRPAGRLRPARLGRPGDAQRRAGQRHHRLPRPRLLRARDRALDPDRAAHRPSASATARARATIGAAEDQDFRLHQRLRPSPRRPHRHSRPRARRRGDLSDHARRLRRRDRLDRPDHRPRLQLGDGRRRGRDDRRHLYGARAAGPSEAFLDAYRRVGMAPFKEALYERNAGADI